MSGDCAPIIIENFPAVHFSQTEAPSSENVPAGQFKHMSYTFAPFILEYLPALQSKHTTDELAATVLEYLPALHCTHVDDP
jgi:hypothetical protein